MKTIKNVLLYVWQLPQNIIGVILTYFYKVKLIRKEGNINIYQSDYMLGGISLGKYIILRYKNESSIKHELGHCKQSLLLGPLYLIVIGLPSILHNMIHSLFNDIGIYWDYYKFYTESWANKLMETK